MISQSEFRNSRYADAILSEIRHLSEGRRFRIVHVCGTHEDTISRHGLRTLLPDNIKLVAGPGCPVCVCAAEDVDTAIELARQGHLITTFGDMVNVPSTSSSLAKERAQGADVRIVYGVNEAVGIAQNNSEREVVFVGVGFETTAPTLAVEMLRDPPSNFSMLTSLKAIPPAMELLLRIEGPPVDGFITPGHVSAIIGTNAFEPLAKRHHVPCVAAGFEPLDVLESVRMILTQIRDNRAESENEYSRVVRPEGNRYAQQAIRQAFNLGDGPWRGLGVIKDSAYYLRSKFAEHDSRKRFEVPRTNSVDILPGCMCHKVVLGMIDPVDCPLFGKRCVPDNPYGPCMVGHEGTCRIRHENLSL
ncbi:MAG: hydrogenase formation protein HypD [Candidatus Thorarchaeota archaeon]|nr:MAG: hydrogenase formation protein HypD [Candidatus Thorarchaeota archaeon]